MSTRPDSKEAKKRQEEYLKKCPHAFGGTLLKTRAGRAKPRPLATSGSGTIHLVLRSSRAKGPWSFRASRNEEKIKAITARFVKKYAVTLHSMANVRNHLHLHIGLAHKASYKPFIRALTSSIAMAITGASRWNPLQGGKFWDYRPFSRLVYGVKAFLRVNDYVDVNELEGMGYFRGEAREIIAWRTYRRAKPG